MDVQPKLNRTFAFLGSLLLAAVLFPAFQAPAAAQYAVTNLDSNLTNAIHKNEADLINAWGVAYFPGGPFWGNGNGPWAIALAPPNFGFFNNALLVGNNGNGRINVFDFTSGRFLGQLTNHVGKTPPLVEEIKMLKGS